MFFAEVNNLSNGCGLPAICSESFSTYTNASSSTKAEVDKKMEIVRRLDAGDSEDTPEK